MRIPVLVGSLILAASAAAADRPCSKGDAAAASKALDRVNTWQQMRKSWQDWRHCDTGPMADAYSDALLRLAVDWKNVDALASDMREDRGYHDFVLTHLKSAAKEDRDALYSRATRNCPSGRDAFCGEIAAAVKGEAVAPAASETLDLAPMRRIPDPPKR